MCTKEFGPQVQIFNDFSIFSSGGHLFSRAEPFGEFW